MYIYPHISLSLYIYIHMYTHQQVESALLAADPSATGAAALQASDQGQTNKVQEALSKCPRLHSCLVANQDLAMDVVATKNTLT